MTLPFTLDFKLIFDTNCVHKKAANVHFPLFYEEDGVVHAFFYDLFFESKFEEQGWDAYFEL